jgi:hypothetical protein
LPPFAQLPVTSAKAARYRMSASRAVVCIERSLSDGDVHIGLHRRKFVFDRRDSALLISDVVDCADGRCWRARLGLGTGTTVELLDEACALMTGKCGQAVVVLVGPTHGCRMSVGEGWISPSYGVRRRAPVLWVEASGVRPQERISLSLHVVEEAAAKGAINVNAGQLRERHACLTQKRQHSLPPRAAERFQVQAEPSGAAKQEGDSGH